MHEGNIYSIEDIINLGICICYIHEKQTIMEYAQLINLIYKSNRNIK